MGNIVVCGIAGVCWNGEGAFEIETPLRAMRHALRHRGPDDAGLYLSRDGRAGLAHTRLSVLDPSPAGHQPMSTPDGRLTIILNGEIYNFEELRRELEATGESFRSHSDTEVILRLYEKLGPDCVRRLKGMFALAIWDEGTGSCFLARDPLGIKPLYVARSASRLLFASELRGVLASGLVEKRLDPESVRGYFEGGSIPEPGTLVRGVEMLAAGSWLLWKRGEVTSSSWWSLRFSSHGVELEKARRSVREALLDSVRRHLVSDVPVGAFLSGGIDSTAIVALCRLAGKQDLRTFSIRLEDPQLDEGEVARRTADHFGTRHAERTVDGSTGRLLFEKFLTRFDQPSIDGFNTFTVSEFASSEGMKVVLSGLGGDELFGGYPSFRDVPRIYRWGWALGSVPVLRRSAARALRANSRPQLRRLGGFLEETPSLAGAYRAFRGVFPVREARALAARFTGVAESDIGSPWMELAPQPTPKDEISALEIQGYMRNQLLRDSDVMSMAWGLELRVPFVDSALLEEIAGIPASMRLRAGKRMLLEAVPEIPEWVRNLPKRGFHFPFEQWLAGDWQDLFAEAASGRGVRAQTWYQKWSLFLLGRWCIENGVEAA